MGPPSRYNLYATAHARAQQAQQSGHPAAIVDTETLSNTDLAKHYLRLFAAARTLDEFAARADSAFSRSVNMTVNGLHLSRELYAQQWGAAFHAQGTITFCGAVETPSIRIPVFQNAALVGIMYDARFTSSLNEQMAVSVTSTINIIIAEDKTLPSTCADRRRIVSVNQVIVDKDGVLPFPLRSL